MTRAAKLAQDIERTVSGPMWHGSALGALLDGVTADEAAARSIPGAHSVWEIVLHVIAWADVSRARVQGDQMQDPAPDVDWPPVADRSAAAWQATLDRLTLSHRQLAAVVRVLDEAALDAMVGSLGYSVST